MAHGLRHHLSVSPRTAWPWFDSIAIMTPDVTGRGTVHDSGSMVLPIVAISLREMSLVRCTLHSQGQLPFSGSINEVVLRIAPKVLLQWADCKARLDGARRLHSERLLCYQKSSQSIHRGWLPRVAHSSLRAALIDSWRLLIVSFSIPATT